MNKPILTYNGTKFYDLDEVELYLADLPTISEQRAFRKYTQKIINEDKELYEMAYTRTLYIREYCAQSHPVHYTIANIICLEDVCPETINHWSSELLAFTKDVIRRKINRNINKNQLLREQLISEFAEPYKDGYTYLDSIIYEDAMIDEINKANRRLSTPARKKTAKYIKSHILPNIEEYVEPNKERVYKIFNGLINAANKADVSIFRNALDEFILNEINN